MITPFVCAFLLFDRAAGFLPPRPQNAEAGARRCCPGWPGSGPPEGLGLDSIEHDGTLVMSGPPHAGWDTGSDIFLTSKLRPWWSTLQAMRASLLASAIASTLWCSRRAAASIQGLRP